MVKQVGLMDRWMSLKQSSFGLTKNPELRQLIVIKTTSCLFKNARCEFNTSASTLQYIGMHPLLPTGLNRITDVYERITT